MLVDIFHYVIFSTVTMYNSRQDLKLLAPYISIRIQVFVICFFLLFHTDVTFSINHYFGYKCISSAKASLNMAVRVFRGQINTGNLVSDPNHFGQYLLLSPMAVDIYQKETGHKKIDRYDVAAEISKEVYREFHPKHFSHSNRIINTYYNNNSFDSIRYRSTSPRGLLEEMITTHTREGSDETFTLKFKFPSPYISTTLNPHMSVGFASLRGRVFDSIMPLSSLSVSAYSIRRTPPTSLQKNSSFSERVVPFHLKNGEVIYIPDAELLATGAIRVLGIQDPLSALQSNLSEFYSLTGLRGTTVNFHEWLGEDSDTYSIFTTEGALEFVEKLKPGITQFSLPENLCKNNFSKEKSGIIIPSPGPEIL